MYTLAFLSLTHLPTSAHFKWGSSYHAYSLGFWFGKLVHGLSTERVQIWTSVFVIPPSKDSSKFILSLNDLITHSVMQQIFTGNSLEIQWLGLHTSTVGGTGSTPGLGRKILHAAHQSQKNKRDWRIKKLFTKHLLTCQSLFKTEHTGVSSWTVYPSG